MTGETGPPSPVVASTFLFPFGKQDVVITLFYSQQTGTVWVLVSRKTMTR